MTVYGRIFRTSLRALGRNKTRSALTCLGIIIGIAAVIAMMEIGNGVSALNAKAIASLGANNLMIQPGQQQPGGVSYGAGSTITLTPQDADAIAEQCPAVRYVAPVVNAYAQVIYANRNWVPQQINGTTPAFLDVREWTVESGAPFTEQDVRNVSKVCLIGKTIETQLFGGEPAVGRELRLGSVTMKVLGVLPRKGANMFGRDQDDIIVAPWTTIKYRVSGQTGSSSGSSAGSASASEKVNTLSNMYPSSGVQLYPQQSAAQQANNPVPVRFTNISMILATARSSADVSTAVDQITRLLRERHRLRPDEPDDFSIRNTTELSDTLGKTTDLIRNLLTIVAAISLLVGGVGIMNIMLVSVTERTREIGLRMAIGARARDILRQFLVEAVVLCLIGGATGILLGRLASLLVRQLMRWPTQISIPTIVAAVAVSASVGIVFGWYPAWKASRLDPIEALRYE